MNHPALGKTNPFLAAYCSMIPKGPVLFLGAGGGAEIIHLAAKGYAVCVFEQDAEVIDRTRALTISAGVSVQWQRQDRSQWRLDFERWAGIVALFPRWRIAERRRLMAAIPNALAPNGSFLFEGYAEGPSGPQTLDDYELDPEDFRADLDVLDLARFATVSRPVRQCADESMPTWVLQVVGTHLDLH